MDVIAKEVATAVLEDETLRKYITMIPLMLALLAILVKLTPTKKDDEILAKVQELYTSVKE